MMRLSSSKVPISSPLTAMMRSPGQELAVGGVPRQHDADRRRQERPVADEHREVEQHREDQVHHRPGEHDDHALVRRQRLEGAAAGLRAARRRSSTPRASSRSRRAASSEMQYSVSRPRSLQDLRPEAEAEGEHLDAERLGEQEMPELVDEDQRADEDDEVQRTHAARARRREPSTRNAGRGRSCYSHRAERTEENACSIARHAAPTDAARARQRARQRARRHDHALVDEAGAICAMRHAHAPCVTDRDRLDDLPAAGARRGALELQAA